MITDGTVISAFEDTVDLSRGVSDLVFLSGQLNYYAHVELEAYLALSWSWPLDTDKDTLVGISWSDLDRWDDQMIFLVMRTVVVELTHSGYPSQDLIDTNRLNPLGGTSIVRS